MARQYRRVERYNIADHGFASNSSAICLRSSSKVTRARTEHRCITVPFGYRVHEPVNLAIELAETQFKLGTSGVRLG
jgi:hypothetical protein